MTQTIRALKKSLRKEMGAKLSTLSADVVERETKAVTEKLFQLREYQASQNVCTYISMSGEIVTRAIIQDLFQKNKTCYVPRWGKDEMEMVRLESWEDYLLLPVNRWNIPEPAHDQARDNALDNDGLDLIIMPGLAFDTTGNRLGHGKGYYDRYLTKCNEWARATGCPRPRTVALALEAQMLEAGQIPADETDHKPDLIITAERVVSQD